PARRRSVRRLPPALPSSSRRPPTIGCTSRTALRALRSLQPCVTACPSERLRPRSPGPARRWSCGRSPATPPRAPPSSWSASPTPTSFHYRSPSQERVPMSNPYDRPSDPAKRHSAALTDGIARAGARAMLKGTGFDDDDLARPLIGVATSWIETMPCNLNQRELAQDVKRGIRA